MKRMMIVALLALAPMTAIADKDPMPMIYVDHQETFQVGIKGQKFSLTREELTALSLEIDKAVGVSHAVPCYGGEINPRDLPFKVDPNMNYNPALLPVNQGGNDK